MNYSLCIDTESGAGNGLGEREGELKRSCVVHVLLALPLQVGGLRSVLSDVALQSLVAVFGPEIALDFSLVETRIDSVSSAGEFGRRELCKLLGQLQQPSDASPSSDLWQAWLLVVPQIVIRERSGLGRPLGLMFSEERQGCAVALETIRNLGRQYADSYERLLLHTVAHELGHVFNLGHDYQRSTMMTPTHVLRSHSSFPHNLRFGIAPGHRRWLGSGPEQLVRPGGSRYRGSWASG